MSVGCIGSVLQLLYVLELWYRVVDCFVCFLQMLLLRPTGHCAIKLCFGTGLVVDPLLLLLYDAGHGTLFTPAG